MRFFSRYILSVSLKMRFVYLWRYPWLSPMSLAISILSLWTMAFDSSLTRAANSSIAGLVFSGEAKRKLIVVLIRGIATGECGGGVRPPNFRT